MEDENEFLKIRVKELEDEIRNRDIDLARIRKELAETHQFLQKAIINVEDQLKLASLIQKVLSPTEVPHIPGIEISTKFIPGQTSGGDYFDIFEHNDKLKFGIMVSCASGYSLSALFLSVLLKFSGQLEARKGAEPHVMLEKMGREMAPHIAPQDKASLFYCVFDRRTLEITYCSLGRVVALVFNAEEKKISQLQSLLNPLTRDFDFTLSSQHTALNSKDKVLILSEGVVNAKNPKGEMFGIERIYKAILQAPQTTVHEVRNEILFRVEKFTETQEVERDRTIVVLEVKDHAIKLSTHSRS